MKCEIESGQLYQEIKRSQQEVILFLLMEGIIL